MPTPQRQAASYWVMPGFGLSLGSMRGNGGSWVQPDSQRSAQPAYKTNFVPAQAGTHSAYAPSRATGLPTPPDW